MSNACGESAEESMSQSCPTLSRAAHSVRANLSSASKRITIEIMSAGLAITKNIRELTRLFVQREQCLWRVRRALRPCLRIAEKSCNNSALRVLEINRMKIEDMDFVIQAFPDVHYFYYTRDPRGIALI